MVKFKSGQEIEAEQPHSRRKGNLTIKEILGDTEIVVSQPIVKREKFPLYPNDIIRIFTEEEGLISIFQGILVTPTDTENLKSDDIETSYLIKNIHLKRCHPKRRADRLKVEMATEVAAKSGFFSRKHWSGTTLDISSSGVQLLINGEPPVPGTEITALINLGGRKIRIRGEVKGVNPGSPRISEAILGQAYGINVEINKISDSDFAWLNEYLQKKNPSG